MDLPKIVKLANRLSEAVLFNWEQEEVVKLAWETAAECNKIVTEFHKEQGVVCKDSLQTQTLE